MPKPRRLAAVLLVPAAGLAGAPVAASAAAVSVSATATHSAAAAVGTSATGSAAVAAGGLRNYVVNAPVGKRLGPTEAAIKAAGGRIVQRWPQIGVLIVQSTSATFLTKLRTGKARATVVAAGATRTATTAEGAGGPAHAPAQTTDRSMTQWDLAAIRADQAHKRSRGSSKVVVAVVDTGVDDTHPDLTANFDASRSVDCTRNGVPDRRPGGWRPSAEAGHGTHVAGTIAAGANGFGVTGVAPATRIAAVKVVSPKGFIYAEYAICGMMWVAQQKFPIANHSYYVDPWQYWCSTAPDQLAIRIAMQRATAYAIRAGNLPFVSAGNEGDNLNQVGTESTSPNDSQPRPRRVNAFCTDLPGGLPGVVRVGSTANNSRLSYFSNYGLGQLDVVAPGSSITSTLPGKAYGESSGTSMAAPHAAGVAALILARHRGMTPAQLRFALRTQTRQLPCVTAGCSRPGGVDPQFGTGIVDALNAVTR